MFLCNVMTFVIYKLHVLQLYNFFHFLDFYLVFCECLHLGKICQIIKKQLFSVTGSFGLNFSAALTSLLNGYYIVFLTFLIKCFHFWSTHLIQHLCGICVQFQMSVHKSHCFLKQKVGRSVVFFYTFKWLFSVFPYAKSF